MKRRGQQGLLRACYTALEAAGASAASLDAPQGRLASKEQDSVGALLPRTALLWSHQPKVLTAQVSGCPVDRPVQELLRHLAVCGRIARLDAAGCNLTGSLGAIPSPLGGVLQVLDLSKNRIEEVKRCEGFGRASSVQACGKRKSSACPLLASSPWPRTSCP